MKNIRKFLLWLTLAFASIATAADPGIKSSQTPAMLMLTAGKSQVVTLGAVPTRVSVANPEIADVTLLKSSELYAVGKKAGTTNIFLWSKNGQLTAMDVIVSADTAGLEAKLKELLPGEDKIRVSSAGDALVLTGEVTDAIKVHRVMLIAEQFSGKKIINMLGIGDVPQVLLEVKVAEVSKKLTDKLGVEFGINGTRGNFTYSLLGSFLTGGILSSPPGSGAGIELTSRNDSLKLEAEIKNGLVKILAEPNIIAISGQEGAFLAGGKIFIPVPQSNTNGASSITLEEREYGVGLKFLPTVLENQKINLKVTPEVSELSLEGTTIKAGNSTSILPTISTRRASTTVQLMDGQSFAIGGLIKNNVTETIKGFPFLSELPILGALFRSSEFINDRSELMFLITPRLVKPLSAAVSLPTDKFIAPTRSEFLLNGQLEGKPRQPEAAPTNPSPAATPLKTSEFEASGAAKSKELHIATTDQVVPVNAATVSPVASQSTSDTVQLLVEPAPNVNQDALDAAPLTLEVESL